MPQKNEFIWNYFILSLILIFLPLCFMCWNTFFVKNFVTSNLHLNFIVFFNLSSL